MRRIDLKLEQRVVNAYLSSPNGGRSLAATLGIGGTTLYRVLSRNGISISEEKRHGRSVRRYVLTEKQEHKVVERYRNGERTKVLGREFNCSDQTIRSAINRGGVSLTIGRPREHIARPNLQSDIQKAVDMAATGLSQAVIATHLNTSQTTVSGWLRMSGVDRSHYWRGAKSGSWKGGRSRTSQGYMAVTLPISDPMMSMAAASGSVLEHRLVMAQQLGRPLAKPETVHHINGDRTDNRPENLQLRTGKHGKGVVLRCCDCGSRNIETVHLADG